MFVKFFIEFARTPQMVLHDIDNLTMYRKFLNHLLLDGVIHI